MPDSEITPPPNDFVISLSKELGNNYAFVPEKFRFGNSANPIPPEITQPDRLCNMSTLTPETRTHITSAISECIKAGNKVVALEVDADQLKSANTKVSRQFGDQVIVYSASIGCRLIQESGITCKLFAVRPGTSPDETLFIFINPSDKDLVQIQNIRKILNESHKVAVPNPKGKSIDFSIGSSCGLSSSDSGELSKLYSETRAKLLDGSLPSASHFFNVLTEAAASSTKTIKILHELANIPANELLNLSLPDLENTLVHLFGGTRISGPALRLILKLNAVAAARSLAQNDHPDATIRLPEEFSILRNPHPLRAIIDAFNSTFGQYKKH